MDCSADAGAAGGGVGSARGMDTTAASASACSERRSVERRSNLGSVSLSVAGGDEVGDSANPESHECRVSVLDGAGRREQSGEGEGPGVESSTASSSSSCFETVAVASVAVVADSSTMLRILGLRVSGDSARYSARMLLRLRSALWCSF